MTTVMSSSRRPGPSYYDPSTGDVTHTSERGNTVVDTPNGGEYVYTNHGVVTERRPDSYVPTPPIVNPYPSGGYTPVPPVIDPYPYRHDPVPVPPVIDPYPSYRPSNGGGNGGLIAGLIAGGLALLAGAGLLIAKLVR